MPHLLCLLNLLFRTSSLSLNYHLEPPPPLFCNFCALYLISIY